MAVDEDVAPAGGDEGDRLTVESRLRFRCGADLPCFTRCCRDVNIFLSPYDVLRLKRRLGVSSEEFLERFTIPLISRTAGFPVVVLRMEEDRDRACPFVGPAGCTVYEDRPWSCRMFPLDRAEQKGAFRIIAPPELCQGLGEDSERGVGEYLQSQDVLPYEEMERPFERIASDPRLRRERIENPRIQEMCRMALYDLDRFRRFVLESRFLQLFYVEKDLADAIRQDDLELMKLAFRWLEFGLVAGGGMRIREDAIQGKASGGRPS